MMDKKILRKRWKVTEGFWSLLFLRIVGALLWELVYPVGDRGPQSIRLITHVYEGNMKEY